MLSFNYKDTDIAQFLYTLCSIKIVICLLKLISQLSINLLSSTDWQLVCIKMPPTGWHGNSISVNSELTHARGHLKPERSPRLDN